MRPIPSPVADPPRRVLQLAHGFPPRENAGTEQYAALLAGALNERGVEVHTLAATRWPGRPMYDLEREPDQTSRTAYGTTLLRVVNNLPYAGVRRGEQDAVMRGIIEAEIRRFLPDLVQVQHPMFLDVGFASPVPVVWTLHDAWGWCAAGGQLLDLSEGNPRPCAGPGSTCAACASRWVQDGPAEKLLLDTAGSLAKLVSAPQLHRAWRKIPAGVRKAILAPRSRVADADITRRASAIRAFAHRCAFLLSPSQYYADLAVRNGLPKPIVLPHGVPPPGQPRVTEVGSPFVFVGTISPHKGPLLVHQAHKLSQVARPLDLWGPPGPDASYVASVDATGRWRGASTDVSAILARAHVLVLGSIWAENAPLIVLEARARSVPIVAPRIGGLPELITESRDGWLYEAGNPVDLARCLRLANDSAAMDISPPPTLAQHVDHLMSHYARVW